MNRWNVIVTYAASLAFVVVLVVLGVATAAPDPPGKTRPDAGVRADPEKPGPLSAPSSGIVDRREGTACEYHGITLKADTVRIIYGLNLHVGGFVDGGCVVRPDSPMWAIVSYCERCRNPLFQGPLQRVLEARGDETRCEVHDQPMEEGVVPIAYGLPGWDRYEHDASKRLFPNARPCLLGGCMVNIDSPQAARVRFCAQCREARENWYAER